MRSAGRRNPPKLRQISLMHWCAEFALYWTAFGLSALPQMLFNLVDTFAGGSPAASHFLCFAPSRPPESNQRKATASPPPLFEGSPKRQAPKREGQETRLRLRQPVLLYPFRHLPFWRRRKRNCVRPYRILFGWLAKAAYNRNSLSFPRKRESGDVWVPAYAGTTCLR